jgi:hypothetical protein
MYESQFGHEFFSYKKHEISIGKQVHEELKEFYDFLNVKSFHNDESLASIWCPPPHNLGNALFNSEFKA